MSGVMYSQYNAEEQTYLRSQDQEPEWVDHARQVRTEKKRDTMIFYSRLSSQSLHTAILLCNFQMRRHIAEYIQKKILVDLHEGNETNERLLNEILAQSVRLYFNFVSVPQIYFEQVQSADYGLIFDVFFMVEINLTDLERYKNQVIEKIL